MKILLLFIIFSTLACAHQKINHKRLEISLNNEILKFDNKKEAELAEVFLAGHRIYLSNFTDIPSEHMAGLIEKRKTLFTNLFQDDVDPYTHKLTSRKQCLKGVQNSRVLFLKGPGKLWSDCHIKSEGSPILAERIWQICRSTLWEITVVPKAGSELIFQCH